MSVKENLITDERLAELVRKYAGNHPGPMGEVGLLAVELQASRKRGPIWGSTEGLTTNSMRLETGMENIARSIREGVFPKQLEPIMVPNLSPEKLLANRIGESLHASRQDALKLDKSELLLIVNALSHYAMAEYGEAEEPSLKFGRALSALPELASAAGCHVGIKVTEAKRSKP